MFCLTGKYADAFIEKLKSDEIDPAKLAEMSSHERNTYFTEFMGKMNASNVNALFESKLLLKNQQQGMITWVKQIAGMKPEVERDLLSIVSRMDKPLNPETKQAFLEDFVAHRLKTRVTLEQANQISQLAKTVANKKEVMNKGGDRMEYGRAVVAFNNYTNNIKLKAKSLTAAERFKYKNLGRNISDITGTAKSLKSSMDLSALFRQGLPVLMTHPVIWTKNSLNLFQDVVKTFGGKAVLDEVGADIISRENYGRMKKAGLAIGVTEEAFPTIFAEKIRVVGRVYKASQDAFTAFQYRNRADVFDITIDIMKQSGIDINDKVELQSIGKLINSLTGRGGLGIVEPLANVTNNVLFSPRFIKSHWDVLTAHKFDPKVSAFAKKQAAINLLKIVMATAATLTIAEVLKPGSVEKDPISADAGNIKVGNTRFDVTGGKASLITLASRLITNSTKSSTTGIITKLGSGEFGSQTRKDVIYNYFEDKFSPTAAVVRDLLEEKTYQGKKPTVTGELVNLFAPMAATNYFESIPDPDSANKVAILIAEELGINTKNYAVNEADWTQSTSAELQQFRKAIGDVKFKMENVNFNKRFNNWFKLNQTNPKWKALSEEDKKRKIAEKKEYFKNLIFAQYNFHYKTLKKKPLPNF